MIIIVIVISASRFMCKNLFAQTLDTPHMMLLLFFLWYPVLIKSRLMQASHKCFCINFLF